MTIDQLRLIPGYVVAKSGIDFKSERGVISTELAVGVFFLIVIAGAVGVILYNTATSQANNIPDTVTMNQGTGAVTTPNTPN